MLKIQIAVSISATKKLIAKKYVEMRPKKSPFMQINSNTTYSQ